MILQSPTFKNENKNIGIIPLELPAKFSMSRPYIARIQITPGSMIKYESLNTENNLYGHSLILDRQLKLPMPVHYGAFPGTLGPDGDEQDMIVVGTANSLLAGHLSNVVIIGVVNVIDKGEIDNKYICVISNNDLTNTDIRNRIKYDLLNYINFLNLYKNQGDIKVLSVLF